MNLLDAMGLAKRYGSVAVFENVSFSLASGEVVAVLGESGVGKSTLLNIIAGLDTCDAGRVVLDGRDVPTLREREGALMRRTQIGFVFQAFHVLPHLSVSDNVALPLLLQGGLARELVDARVMATLAGVGLQALAARAPRQLSGGELQRVAIARALVHRPRLVLADEPTGNLDPDTAERVLDTLVAQVRDSGAACLIVTHSIGAAARADRRLRLSARGMQAS